MNIHFESVERKSQVVSYLLAAFAVFTILMLTLSFSRDTVLHWSFPSTAGQTVQASNGDVPVAVPAPLPPIGQAQPTATPETTESAPSILVPQAIPVPVPSVP